MKTSSENKTNPALWPLLTQHRDASRTGAEWKRIFAGFDPAAIPLLPVVGGRANFVLCPETGIELAIHENRNGTFTALPPEGSELDSRIDGLTIADLRLFRLDWPTICQTLSLNLGLAGKVRTVPGKPWFWFLGESRTDTYLYPYFLAVIRSDTEADEVIVALKSKLSARLLVPALSDSIFHRLTEAKLALHVLADGGVPQFPAAETLLPAARFMLRQGRGAWHFTIDGISGTIADEKGLHYVEYLFKNPPEAPIHAADLQAEVCEMDTNAEGVTEIVDPDSGERITLSRTARLQEHNLSIDDRDANQHIWRIRRSWQRIIDDQAATDMERDEARAEKDKIDGVLASKALRDTSNAAKTYDRIRQTITRLLKHLDAKKTKDGEKDPAYEALANHIRLHLSAASRRYSGTRTSRTRTGTAQTFMYERPEGIVWSD